MNGQTVLRIGTKLEEGIKTTKHFAMFSQIDLRVFCNR